MLGKGKEFRGVRRVSGTHAGIKNEEGERIEEIGRKRKVNKEISQASNSWVNQREQILGITKGGVGMKYQQKVATIISIYGFK